jgi:hypothetical protein
VGEIRLWSSVPHRASCVKKTREALTRGGGIR